MSNVRRVPCVGFCLAVIRALASTIRMENESPNLFDSEPVITRIVAEENHDDVLTELIEEIRDEVTHDVGDENDGADDRSSIEQRDDEHPEPKTKDVVHKGLPPGRVKLIMKMDPDVNIVATDAVFVLTKATVKYV